MCKELDSYKEPSAIIGGKSIKPDGISDRIILSMPGRKSG